MLAYTVRFEKLESFWRQIVVSSTLALHLLKLNWKVVWHIANPETNILIDTCFRNETLEFVYLSFLRCLALIYPGYFQDILGMSKSNIHNYMFQETASSVRVNCSLRETETNHALGSQRNAMAPSDASFQNFAFLIIVFWRKVTYRSQPMPCPVLYDPTELFSLIMSLVS